MENEIKIDEQLVQKMELQIIGEEKKNLKQLKKNQKTPSAMVEKILKIVRDTVHVD